MQTTRDDNLMQGMLDSPTSPLPTTEERESLLADPEQFRRATGRLVGLSLENELGSLKP